MLDTFQPIGIERFEDSKKILIKAKFSEANPSTVFPRLSLKKETVDPKRHISYRFTRYINITEQVFEDRNYPANERLSKIIIAEKYRDYTNDIEFNCKYEGNINVALFNELYTAANKAKIYDEYILGEESPLDHLGYINENSEDVTFEEGSFSLYLKTKNKKFSLVNKWCHLINGETTGSIKIDGCLPVDKQRVFPVLPVLDVNYTAAFKPMEYTRYELEKESN